MVETGKMNSLRRGSSPFIEECGSLVCRVVDNTSSKQQRQQRICEEKAREAISIVSPSP